MKQFVPSNTEIRQQHTEPVGINRDCLGILPSGISWFNALPLHSLIQSGSLTVVLYPAQSVLKQHCYRLRQMGLQDSDFAAITYDIPPHEERAIWERVHQLKVPLLLMTVQRFQSIATLSRLIRYPNLGRLILTQGHLAIPHLWGPSFTSPYQHLTELFGAQWQGHPPLFILSQPLSQQYRELLASMFDLKDPQPLELPLPVESIRLRVQRCITQYQKLKHLKQFIRSNPLEDRPQGTIIVCDSWKEMLHLEKRLHPIPVIVFHQRLEAEEKEMRLLQAMHEKEMVILLDSSTLLEFPTHLFPLNQLRIAHWQIPWSCEALMQQVLLALHPDNNQGIESLLLYSKEDYLSHKNYLVGKLSEVSSSKPIYLDQLHRIRHFCSTLTLCRRTELQNWLAGRHPGREPCGYCDNCKSRQNSSLWRNLLHSILY